MLGRKFLELNFRINEMLLPTLAKRHGEGDRAGFDRALVDTMRYTAVGMLLVAAAGGGAAHDVMQLFGSGFTSASDALAILLLLPGLQALSSIQAQAFYAVDRPLFTTYTAALRAVVTIAATIAGIQLMGLTGAALGLIAGLVVDVAVKFAAVRPHLDAPLLRLWTPRQLLALALAYAAGFETAVFVSRISPTVIDLLPALIAGVVAFALVLRLAGGVDARDRQRARTIIATIRRRRAPEPQAKLESPKSPPQRREERNDSSCRMP
jgi:O-antigen/teichoic acid export membrane protein